jgi:DNA-binding transcriptional ArsR family regulator
MATSPIRLLIDDSGSRSEEDLMDQVFFALSDPIRRRILEALDLVIPSFCGLSAWRK